MFNNITGLDVIQQRRGLKTEKPILLTGPGKVSSFPSLLSICLRRF